MTQRKPKRLSFSSREVLGIVMSKSKISHIQEGSVQSLKYHFRSDITYVTDTISRRRKSRNKPETRFNDTVSCFEFGDNANRRNMHPMPPIPDASPEQQIFEPFDLPLRNNEEPPIVLRRAPFPSAKPNIDDDL